MPRYFTFILGGARSGKSSYAEKLAVERGQQVLYVATAEAWDDEMRVRIAKHRAERPSHWSTLEAPRQVAAALSAYQGTPCDVLLLDCLTLLAGNVIAPLPEPYSEAEATRVLLAEVEALLATYQTGQQQWIVVSNETGLGIVPPYPLGRVYRDALGRVNQRLAAVADEVFFMVAGLPLRLK